MAHAEPDLQGARRRTTEHLVEIHGRIGQRQHEQRLALIQAALLAFGHAAGTHHETLDAPMMAVIALGFTVFVVHHFVVRKWVGQLRINHQQALT